jgi:hypothetical protein
MDLRSLERRSTDLLQEARMRLTSVAMLAGLALAVPGKAVHAQHTASLAPGTTELMTAARLQMPGRLLLSSEQTARSLHVVSARPSRRQGETLMIVGGAVLLTGLLIDEALVSIAGVAIGGYGLYVYLNASPKRR